MRYLREYHKDNCQSRVDYLGSHPPVAMSGGAKDVGAERPGVRGSHRVVSKEFPRSGASSLRRTLDYCHSEPPSAGEESATAGGTADSSRDTAALWNDNFE